jgi:hypothetical protein
VHVTGGTGGLARKLFGCEIGQRPDGGPGGSQLARTGSRDSEVCDLCPTVGQENVRRLEVTMDDPASVQRIEASRDVDEGRNQHGRRECPGLGRSEVIRE